MGLRLEKLRLPGYRNFSRNAGLFPIKEKRFSFLKVMNWRQIPVCLIEKVKIRRHLF